MLKIAKVMGVESVYAIMLPGNQRALELTKKMGFKLEHLSDGAVKGVLDLKEEMLNPICPEPLAKAEKKETIAPEKPENTAKPEEELTPL